MKRIAVVRRVFIAALFTAACASAPATPSSDYQAAISRELDGMLRAWNANDLEAHIAAYADSATWMTGTGVLKGKAAIRETLIKSFKRGDDLLGELAFSNTLFHPVSADVVYTTGSFQLTGLPSGKPINGRSTLIWKKVNGSWRIMHDHSS